MDIIDTLPELHQANINGISGLGYAEASFDASPVTCRGVVVFDRDTDLSTLLQFNPDEEVLYQGIVYTQTRPLFKTLRVKIRYLSLNERVDPGLTFSASLPQE